MNNLQPVIKWSGSKRSQARAIVSLVSGRYGTYYESFCGGCSVLYYILNNRPEQFRRYVCNDINEPLIELYRLIASDYRRVWKSYSELWHGLNDGKGAGDLDKKKEYFYKVRDEFNRTHSPELFFFIMRTTTNGMPRYNVDGDFNNSFHITRGGITPDGALEALEEWSRTLNRHNVEFRSGSYDRISPEADDFLYLDPPYYNTKGMYYGIIDFDGLWDYLRGVPCDYFLSFDGFAGDTDNTAPVPSDIYDEHRLLDSGNSSFRRVMGKSRDTTVRESLYIRRKHNADKLAINKLF